ncbi:MFS transporter [Mycobacterium intermedium]|uniref:MFS transporter n=1 Tax=Mycobacterium intermedium TaxID=28445 RepID=A0A1E3SMH6_MYCIE|nr:MFS transporter [Mycobacterium intermedium]MCV6967060.1 MFS transporter [Mycobacterium intermedium]ODR03365.1 MFS transporter [Mycobacterium intermedium]OPE52945.1 MFS transporter [Mycobacterium intermedium]ORB07720.1 MFS transporter [Mycobacterium intermedium]
MTETASDTGSWRELLGQHLGTSTVLAGGVAMYATNEFLTISLLPSSIAEIGGSRLYAWVTTLYLVGSVVAATTVNAVLRRFGARSSFLLGLFVFGTASLVCGAAPSMEVLIAGRTLQGVAGGLLAGLGYALINAALPRSLWTRGSALVSAMWGVATVVGPAIGGLFAQLGLWRWAFAAMALLTVLMATLVPLVLTGGRVVTGDKLSDAPALKVPVWTLLLMGGAALAVSVAQIPHNSAATAGLLAVGLALIGTAVVVDRRSDPAVLPPSVFGSGPLKWVYLTMAVQMMAVMVDTYVPLFGQRLGHLTPVAAGFLGASLAIGWTFSEIVSASLNSRRVIGYVVLTAPLVMAAGLGLTAVTQRGNAPIELVVLWTLGLLVAGTGIGMAWPHLSVRAMESVDDPAEGGAAAAAINTVQVISAAFGAGIAGVVVNTTRGGEVAEARWLYVVFTVLAAVGVIASSRATRRDRLSAR